MKLAIEPQFDSIVDGPGMRTIIWFQGCAHNCFNCHNPQTHSFRDGQDFTVQEIVDIVKDRPLQDGITLTGGDPFYQEKELLALLIELKKYNINIWCYTGFTWEYLYDHCYEHLKYIDVLVDGLYIDCLKDLSLYFRGSSNQRLINVPMSLKQKEIVLVDETQF